MKIICPKNLIGQFRRECRKRFPNEYFAALYGIRSAEGNFLITRIAPVDHQGDADGVKVGNAGILKSKRAALRNEKEWLGTIHSHCSDDGDWCCEHLSDTDIKSALLWGEAICGVVHVDTKGSRSSVHWYVPSQPPEVIYEN